MRRLARSVLVASGVASLSMVGPRVAAAQTPANDVWLQTFLSPSVSSLLTQISWGGLSYSSNTFRFDLRAWDGTAPVGPSLFYFIELGESAALAPYTLNVPSVALAPSSVYAIVLEQSTAGGASSIGSTLDTQFPGGDFYQKSGTAWQPFGGGVDMGGFKTTSSPVVTAPDVTATPEPASLALLATGVAGLGGWVRRRRKQTDG